MDSPKNPSKRWPRAWGGIALAVGLGCLGLTAPALRAAEKALPLQAQLIWGTDGVKPPNSPFKEVEPALRKRLGRVFKWQRYYEIRRRQTQVRPGKTSRLEMSDKCLLKLAVKDPDMLEVRLIGEGRLTKTMRQPVEALRKGELLVLAGETKEDVNSAWFVVLSVPRKALPPPEGRSTPGLPR